MVNSNRLVCRIDNSSIPLLPGGLDKESADIEKVGMENRYSKVIHTGGLKT